MMDVLGQLSATEQLLLLLGMSTLLGIGMGVSVTHLLTVRHARRVRAASDDGSLQASLRELPAAREALAAEHRRFLQLQREARRLKSLRGTMESHARRQQQRIAALEAQLQAAEERVAVLQIEVAGRAAGTSPLPASPPSAGSGVASAAETSGRFPVLRKRVHRVREES